MATTLAVLIGFAIATLGFAPPQAVRDPGRPPAVGTAAIGGVVTADEPGGQPVRRALVTASGPAPAGGSVSRSALTDDAGRFTVPDLPAGQFTVTVAKAGWVTHVYGERRPGGGGVSIAIADGERRRVDIRLLRGAVIAGRVLDEYGRPVAGARPVILEPRNVGGERRLAVSFIWSALSGQTNDLGEYRVYGIPPGSYVVAVRPNPQLPPTAAVRATSAEEVRWALQQASAPATAATGARVLSMPEPGPTVVYAPVYHPGVTDASAAVEIRLGAGEERRDVDLPLTLVPTALVQGTVVGPDGQPVAKAQLTLSLRQMALSVLDQMTINAATDGQGRFAVLSVRPGEYTIGARLNDLWGATEIAVTGRNVSASPIVLRPGMTMSGRVVFEATSAPAPANLVARVMLASRSGADAGRLSGAGPTSFMGPTLPDGTFSFSGAPPGRYMLSATPLGSAPSAWMLKSVTLGGRDVLDAGFELAAGEDVRGLVVTLTDQVTELSGSLLDRDGRPAAGYFVIVFPTDTSAWTGQSPRMRSPARPTTEGRYRITALLPGEYYVAALTDFRDHELYDTTFLAQVAASAIRITIGPGEKKVLDLGIK